MLDHGADIHLHCAMECHTDIPNPMNLESTTKSKDLQIDQMGPGQFGPGLNSFRQALHEWDLPESEHEQNQRQLAWLSINHMPQ